MKLLLGVVITTVPDDSKTTTTTTTTSSPIETTFATVSTTRISSTTTSITSTSTFTTSTTTTIVPKISGIIVTGGISRSNNNVSVAVEILREDLDGNIVHYCSLPDLPDGRQDHTQSGLVACGGGDTNDTKTSCVTFSSGQWTASHILQHERSGHSSWLSPYGNLLMGTDNTTEMLTDDGKSVMNFTFNSSHLR